ncbi:hypothetical protein ADN01_14315 [Levilinea saccharolytica]|uniref:Glycosyltransferase subfamily 4-like N-terminal domain-containing protein n=2 Tax=Levilinea saccharolytica TaxID=229921 RepID=A0A0P6XW03_9CHLR|nr:hypothetical protein ADN01_14315 [Levilinea saccharolytica]GAP18009.1 glycosyltransferase [Levilinea saccharolytica]
MISPFKVLMISHLRRSRTYARSLIMAKNLVKRGHKVTLLSTAEERKTGMSVDSEDGVRMIESPDLFTGKMRTGWDLWNLFNRLRFMDRDSGQYDIVHTFETRPVSIYPALRQLRRRPALFLTDWNDWWGRGGIISENRPRWYRWLFEGLETHYEEAFRCRADGLTVISTALKQRAVQLGMPPDRIRVISGGATPQDYPCWPVQECRQRVGVTSSSLIVGFSSIVAHYELEMIIKVIAEIKKTLPDAKLMITGKPGTLVQGLAQEYGVSENVFLTGYVSFEDLPVYLGCADLFILPFPDKVYNVGRWPNKIGDYLCAGRPIVANPVGDVKTLLEEHSIGSLAAWDPADFAAKILQIYQNPDLAAQMGQAARKLAEEKLDWQLLTEQLEDFYLQLWLSKQTQTLP